MCDNHTIIIYIYYLLLHKKVMKLLDCTFGEIQSEYGFWIRQGFIWGNTIRDESASNSFILDDEKYSLNERFSSFLNDALVVKSNDCNKWVMFAVTITVCIPWLESFFHNSCSWLRSKGIPYQKDFRSSGKLCSFFTFSIYGSKMSLPHVRDTCFSPFAFMVIFSVGTNFDGVWSTLIISSSGMPCSSSSREMSCRNWLLTSIHKDLVTAGLGVVTAHRENFILRVIAPRIAWWRNRNNVQNCVGLEWIRPINTPWITWRLITDPAFRSVITMARNLLSNSSSKCNRRPRFSHILKLTNLLLSPWLHALFTSFYLLTQGRIVLSVSLGNFTLNFLSVAVAPHIAAYLAISCLSFSWYTTRSFVLEQSFKSFWIHSGRLSMIDSQALEGSVSFGSCRLKYWNNDMIYLL